MTNFSVRQTSVRGKVLIACDAGLICYRAGMLYVYSVPSEKLIKKIPLPTPVLKRFFCRFRIAERLMHMEAKWAVALDNNSLLVQYLGGILCVELDTGKCLWENLSVRGRPLMACRVHRNEGFSDIVCVGDYGDNDGRDPVKVFGRSTDSSEWKVLYTFPDKAVRHIHGIFGSLENNEVFILTGDEDSESGIWKTRDFFKTVEPVVVGKQQYRACRMICGNESGLYYYLTDAPSEKNGIFKIENEKVSFLHSISGTCIYGANAPFGGVFSTTVEPDAHPKNKIDRWLTNRPGAGVVSRDCDVFVLYSDGSAEKIASYTHDGLPLRLFQYGTVVFTDYCDGSIFYSPQNVKKFDNRVFEIKWSF